MAVAHPTEPFDLQDLIDAPDDGYRYEVVDGALVVTASPSSVHQRVVLQLARLLAPAVPPGHEVLPTLAWRIAPGQVPEPDLMVTPTSTVGPHAVDGTPLLVVEVLSPSNRGADLVRKRALYAEGGCPWYWIVDPGGPSVTVLQLADGRYVDAGQATGDDVLRVSDPLVLAVTPSALVRPAAG